MLLHTQGSMCYDNKLLNLSIKYFEFSNMYIIGQYAF